MPNDKSSCRSTPLDEEVREILTIAKRYCGPFQLPPTLIQRIEAVLVAPPATITEQDIKRFRVGDILFNDEQAKIFCDLALKGLRAEALTPSATSRQYTPLHDFVTKQEELAPEDRDAIYRNIWNLYSTAMCPPDEPQEEGPYGWRSAESNQPAWEVPVLAQFADKTMMVLELNMEGWVDADTKDIMAQLPTYWRRLPEPAQ